METYSLVCWGGKDGKTVTLTIASPCVVSLANHGLYDGKGVVFSTSGALPTGVDAGTTYYARSTGTGTFNLYDTETHAKDTANTTGRINTSGSQSGTHNVKGAYYLSLADKSRWTTESVERIYDGLASWNSGRSGASPLGTEVCELGEAFEDRLTTLLTINIPAAACRIESKINGVRTEAYHYGALNAGYILYQTSNSYNVVSATANRTTMDGFTVKVIPGWYQTIILNFSSFMQSVTNMIVIGPKSYTAIGTFGTGIAIGGSVNSCLNNLVVGCLKGFSIIPYAVGLTFANNMATKCGTGVGASGSTYVYGNFYNNIAIGNTTNWQAVTGTTSGTRNAGLDGEAWMAGTGGTRITIATTDFLDYDNGDYRPASASSPQVDSGSEYYGMLDYDIADDERPNYNNGGVEIVDVGPYEFDHEFGNHPASTSFTFTVKDTSGAPVTNYEWRLYLKDPAAGIIGTTELDGSESYGSSSYTYTTNYPGSPIDVVLQIIKDGFEEGLAEYSITASPTSTTIYLTPEYN